MSEEQADNFNKRIVVIDDVPSARRVVRKMLEKIGYTDVIEAADGEAALVLIREKETALIISDWNMPGLAGIDLVRQVKGDPNLAQIPVIMITSSPDKEAVVEAYSAGVHDYVLKPFSFDTLVEKITLVLNKE